jgi:hypothetical protein
VALFLVAHRVQLSARIRIEPFQLSKLGKRERGGFLSTQENRQQLRQRLRTGCAQSHVQWEKTAKISAGGEAGG